jgi:hypothetical protein
MIVNIKYIGRKKLRPMKQLMRTNPKEGSRTAYVPVTNAIIIVTMPIIVSDMACRNKFLVVTLFIILCLSNSKPQIYAIKKWIKTAKMESNIDIASDMINIIKEAFLARSAVP